MITEQLDNFRNGVFVGKLTGSEVLADAVDKALNDALPQAGAAPSAAVIALVLAKTNAGARDGLRRGGAHCWPSPARRESFGDRQTRSGR